MTAADLLRALEHAGVVPQAPTAALPAVTVTGIAYDSRRVTPGTIFVALRGQQDDGVRHAPQAVARGAVAVVAETAPPAGSGVPWVVVGDARLALALLADAFHRQPSRSLRLVGAFGGLGGV